MTLRSRLALFSITFCVIATSVAIEAAPPPPRQKAEVVERDSRGRATVVNVDGQNYKVCSAQVTDSCINPRQAGLNFGNHPLQHWPHGPTPKKK